MKFARPVVVLQPKMNAKYEGVTNRGMYVEFFNGFAEVDDEQFEILKQHPSWGVEFIEVSERGMPINQPARPTVKAVGDRPEEGDKVVVLENQVKQLTEMVSTLVSSLQAQKEQPKTNKQLKERKTAQKEPEKSE